MLMIDVLDMTSPKQCFAGWFGECKLIGCCKQEKPLGCYDQMICYNTAFQDVRRRRLRSSHAVIHPLSE